MRLSIPLGVALTAALLLSGAGLLASLAFSNPLWGGPAPAAATLFVVLAAVAATLWAASAGIVTSTPYW